MLPLFKNAIVNLDTLQDWLDLQIAGVDITVENFSNMTEQSKSYYYGKIEAFEFIKTHVHELVK